LHRVLTQFGFTVNHADHPTAYIYKLNETSELPAASVTVPFVMQDNEYSTIQWNKAVLECANGIEIPDAVRQAVRGKLDEAINLLEQNKTDAVRLEKEKNGSMVQNEEEMKKLGDSMGKVKTARQLKKEGWVSDPIQ
jgi:hypothetical protein